jgi:hypothetical protein
MADCGVVVSYATKHVPAELAQDIGKYLGDRYHTNPYLNAYAGKTVANSLYQIVVTRTVPGEPGETEAYDLQTEIDAIIVNHFDQMVQEDDFPPIEVKVTVVPTTGE